MSLYVKKFVCFRKFQILKNFPTVSNRRNLTISTTRTNIWEEFHDKKRDQKTTICINGLRKTEHGEMIPLIVGVVGKPNQQEDEKNFDNLLESPKIIEPRLGEQCQKYVISGVYSSSQGPVFVLSGAAHQKTVEEDAAPTGVKYGIVGIKEGPNIGSSYHILSGAIPGEEKPPTEETKSNYYFIRQLAVAVLKVIERGLKEYEGYQKQQEVVTDGETPTRFVVNGVHSTPRGSVYIVAGVTSQNTFTKREV